MRTTKLIIQLIKTIPFKVHWFILSVLELATLEKLKGKLQMKFTFWNGRTPIFGEWNSLSTIQFFYRHNGEMNRNFLRLLEIDTLERFSSRLLFFSYSDKSVGEKNWNLVIERQTFIATTTKNVIESSSKNGSRLKIIGFELNAAAIVLYDCVVL